MSSDIQEAAWQFGQCRFQQTRFHMSDELQGRSQWTSNPTWYSAHLTCSHVHPKNKIENIPNENDQKLKSNFERHPSFIHHGRLYGGRFRRSLGHFPSRVPAWERGMKTMHEYNVLWGNLVDLQVSALSLLRKLVHGFNSLSFTWKANFHWE